MEGRMNGMSEDYRELIQMSRMTGEAVQLPLEEHSREALLSQMQGWLEDGAYEASEWREQSICEDLLLVLKREDEVTCGMYSQNRPDMDLVIVAPPPLMALILGEYSLAVKLCSMQEIPVWRNCAEELLQDGKRAGIGGGRYSFGEACLLSMDMSVGDKLFFWQMGYYDADKLFLDGEELFTETYFHGVGKISEDAFRQLVVEIKEMDELFEGMENVLAAVVRCALRMDMDRNYKGFWKFLYESFGERTQRCCIVEAMHAYFVKLCSANSLSPHYEERILNGLQEYFQYEDKLPMKGAVEIYLLERIMTRSYIEGCWRPYLERYLRMVKGFEGEIDEAWQQGMYELLKLQDVQWLQRGMQSGFLRKNYIKDYIEYLLQEHFSERKEYSEFISRLIQLKWQIADA